VQNSACAPRTNVRGTSSHGANECALVNTVAVMTAAVENTRKRTGTETNNRGFASPRLALADTLLCTEDGELRSYLVGGHAITVME
jgi:hypothetical protein